VEADVSLAYYDSRPDPDHWSDLWDTQLLSSLLAVARRDPLSHLLEENLPTQGLVLEGGCGLGQYVVYFMRRGYAVIGADFGLRALRIHKEAYPESPMLGLDLRRMPFADAAFRGHISLGVVEHLEEGPQEMLREFYRTLAPGGVLLLSVPWVNTYRRLAAPLIRQRQSRLCAEGVSFYQYAFTRCEIGHAVRDAGFRVKGSYPYSPAKGMVEVPLLGVVYRQVRSRSVRSQAAAGSGGQQSGEGSVHGLRRVLYWPPILRFFAHMILVVAQKPER
jgi:SAM-dependent methyltransferase